MWNLLGIFALGVAAGAILIWLLIFGFDHDVELATLAEEYYKRLKPIDFAKDDTHECLYIFDSVGVRVSVFPNEKLHSGAFKVLKHMQVCRTCKFYSDPSIHGISVCELKEQATSAYDSCRRWTEVPKQ